MGHIYDLSRTTTILGRVCDGVYNFLINVVHNHSNIQSETVVWWDLWVLF